MNRIILLISCFLSFPSFAQNWDFEKPDFKKIEANIKDQGSSLFYESLMQRFLKADSTMTIEEKRHLYYGYSFQEQYSPYGRSGFEDSLNIILQKAELNEMDLDKIIQFGDSILSSNPFELSTLNYQMYAYDQLGDSLGLKNKIIQYEIILDVLMSSGDGTSKENAFYVIDTSHEYELLGILGFEFGGTQSLIEHYDYLTIKENELGFEGLFFDVSTCFRALKQMFKE